MASKPALCDHGHISVVSSSFPPSTGGSSIVMANLLNYFDPNSLTLLSTKWPIEKIRDAQLKVERKIVYRRFGFSHRLNLVKEKFGRPRVVKRIAAEAKASNSIAIVAVYPDLFLMSCAMDAAELIGVPVFPYLHDTLVETQKDESDRKLARKIQNRLFSSAKKIFVMSDGMKSLFKRKYSQDAISLVHTYPETDDLEDSGSSKQTSVMFCGDLYDINTAAIKRIAEACSALGLKLKISTTKDANYHEKLGFDIESIEIVFFPEREDYLKALRDSSILILGLSWPDETTIHSDEMSTIFPTKTCEYLASNTKVLVHCPEEYFLSEFFESNACGICVSSRDPDIVASSINDLLNLPEGNSIVENAKNTLNIFRVENVAPILKASLEDSLLKNS